MLKIIIVVISLLILAGGLSYKLLKLTFTKQKTIDELNKRVTEKQNYFKNKEVIKSLMERQEYVIKNNKISFFNDYIQVLDHKNSSRATNINFSDILEVKKEYLGNVYQQFVGDKIWDGYAIVIVYSDANRIAQKRICLKEDSKTISDIVDSVAVNTLSNVIIEKIQEKSKK